MLMTDECKYQVNVNNNINNNKYLKPTEVMLMGEVWFLFTVIKVSFLF